MVIAIAQLLIMSATAQPSLSFTFSSQPSPLLWHRLVSEIEHSQIERVCWRVSRIESARRAPPPQISVDVRGVCEVPTNDVPWRPQPLGWVDIVNREWTPRVHVDCGRIAETVKRVEERDLDDSSDAALARAMAVVVRHELRHLVRRARQHDGKGDFRPALNLMDFAFPSLEHPCAR